MKDDHINIKIGDYKIPLIGVPRKMGLIQCQRCKKEFELQEIRITYDSKCFCFKCAGVNE